MSPTTVRLLAVGYVALVAAALCVGTYRFVRKRDFSGRNVQLYAGEAALFITTGLLAVNFLQSTSF